MAQIYSNPRRESEPGALPDVEVYEVRNGPHVIMECGSCDQYHPLDFDGDCRDDKNRYAGAIDYAERNDVMSDDVTETDGMLRDGWYWQMTGTQFNRDGSCHPDCGPIVMDGSDIRGESALLDGEGNHAHENEDGRCWHESWHTPIGPFATEQEAIDDARIAAIGDDDETESES